MSSHKMDNQQDHPLISMALMTYNQEKFVLEALRSVLNQTYDNIQIVVSDDCSKDGTWDVILSELDSYRKNGGKHVNIVLNQNQTNMGVAKHFEKILSKCKGELVVCQAGDDISLPERVRCIVDSFHEHPYATVFSHEAISIDEKGNEVGDGIVRTSSHMPLGALMAYSRRVYDEFGPIVEEGAWEDDVYAHRAQMIGEEVQINKVLLKYRVGGSGISSGRENKRVRRTRVSWGCLAAARQSRKDLANCKDSISADKYSMVIKDIDRYEKYYADEYDMYNATNWMQKFHAFHRLNKKTNCVSYAYHFAELLLPRWLFAVINPFAQMGKWLLDIKKRR